MGNALFDWMIQRENAQTILIVFAIGWMIGVGIAYRIRGRGEDASERARQYWMLLLLLGPLALALWFVYNLIMDLMGLDSVAALGINLLIFICIGLLIGWMFRKTTPANQSTNSDENNPH